MAYDKQDIEYSSREVFKRVLVYALKSKFLILISLLALLIFSALEVLQPLLIKNLIDGELSGVQTVWMEVSEENKYSVTLDGQHFMKKRKDFTAIDHYTIRYFEPKKTYVLLDSEFGSKAKITKMTDAGNFIVGYPDPEADANSDELILSEVSGRILSKDDMIIFYSASKSRMITLLIIFAVVSIVILITRFIEHVAFTTASMRLTLDMRNAAFNKLNRLPIKYFTKEPHGKTVTKVTYDSEGVRGLYQVIFSILSAVVTLIIVYAGLIYLDLKLALLTLIGVPFIYLWLSVYRRTINRYNKDIREMNSLINGKLAEFVNGVGIIQLFTKEEQMTQEYDDMLTTNYYTKMKSVKINSVFGWEMLLLLRRLGTAFIILYFGLQYFSPTVVITATTIYVYVEYLEKLVGPIADIFMNLNSLEDSLVSAARIFELLDEPEDIALGKKSDVVFSGDIEFENVSFAYEGDNYVLKDINLKIEKNQFVGLVGHTGSGKSTMMNLLERYYDFEIGTIYVDGVDFKTYTKQEVRQNIGIILQDPSIFEGTIKSNITLGDEVDDKIIEDILIKIGGKKFVSEFAEGIHTPVTYMGDNLSSGEKQLISFARILLANPSIIILDEATANIDTETEQLIQNALTVLSENRTTIVVAHRLSTIRQADVIYVLDDGYLVESGTHDELYQITDGVYRSIYDAQYEKEVI